jgi:hypothetical protein
MFPKSRDSFVELIAIDNTVVVFANFSYNQHKWFSLPLSSFWLTRASLQGLPRCFVSSDSRVEAKQTRQAW